MAQRFTSCAGKLNFMLHWLICQPVPTTHYDSVVKTYECEKFWGLMDKVLSSSKVVCWLADIREVFSCMFLEDT